MIDVAHLYKTYSGGVNALKNVSLKVDKGEFVFLTGSSGAGKTTLFKMLSAFDRPSSGKIAVAGYDLMSIPNRDLPIFRRKIGVVFQDFRLLKDRDAFDNVALPLLVRGESKLMIESKVRRVLDQVGLLEKSDVSPEIMSGGEQQRIAIARAIVGQPVLLVADEPTGNLDPTLSEDIMDLFERVCSQGTTVVIATHDHEMVKRRNKRTLTLENGVLRDEASF
ncbi:MAG: cell division ATP-binding protein FtsE [Bdellovibrionaceae bacterium]|nr:cell division ATP-binding protein FtsE [Pseudobdellovibrionaceae bacterium]